MAGVCLLALAGWLVWLDAAEVGRGDVLPYPRWVLLVTAGLVLVTLVLVVPRLLTLVL